ncbi:MAG: symmetrical bis(5'-nucleosyl)-tetraphosphatase [Gammaproteobacteria bacterium]|nr:symmetrical bis(5'-nucleosyl)-tetraphosphatase [Gammaproteobacteria bacterium]
MAVYAIGDLQGCCDDLQRLLDKIKFDPRKDKIWLVGDLISRGPQSLETLRYLISLGDAVISVLGNHDLHMLAVDAGVKTTKDPSLHDILNAKDRRELMDWLRRHPLIHYDKKLDYTMVHAGIYPKWSLKQAQQYASELEAILQSDNYLDFFEHMYGNKPIQWSDDLEGWDRLRFICNSFTRMRFANAEGKLDFETKGSIGNQAKSYMPWYDVPKRKAKKNRIIFGHWSTLSLTENVEDQHKHNVYAIDTGCIWGGKLTALRIDIPEAKYIRLDCPAHREAKSC